MILSAPGIPTMGIDMKKIYFAKGEKIGNFVVPFNIAGTTAEIYYRFGLWNSTNGVCMPGKDHKPISGGKYKWVSREPVLCGDKILGKAVKIVYNRYNHQSLVWTVRVIEFGEPETIKAEEGANAAIDSMASGIEKVGKLTEGFFDDFFGQVLKAVQTAQGPLILEPAQPILELLKQNYKAEIDKIKQGIDDKKWH